MMNILLSCIFLLFTSVAGFGVGQLPLQQHHSRGTTASLSTTTTLHVLPIDTQTPVEMSNVAHSMWIATIDSDIANIQLEEFRKVFAGGIVSDEMMDGLMDWTDGLIGSMRCDEGLFLLCFDGINRILRNPEKVANLFIHCDNYAFRLHVDLTIHYVFLLLHCTDNVRFVFSSASTNVILFFYQTQSDTRHGYNTIQYNTIRCDAMRYFFPFLPFFTKGGNGGRFDLHHVARDHY